MLFSSSKKSAWIINLFAPILSIVLILYLLVLFYYHHPILKGQAISPSSQNFSFIPQISHASRQLPQIALTFDADMTPFMKHELITGAVKSWYDPKIVDIFKQKKVPATIFMTGMWVETYPDIAASLAKNPLFEIANHSYSHPGFTKNCYELPSVPSWGKNGEFDKSQAVIKKYTGLTPKFFRFPGGCHTDSDVKLANSYGLSVVDWDVNSGDAFNFNAQSIVNQVQNNVQNGSIILFHFNGGKNSPETVNVLSQIIDHLQNKGFVFVKLTDLLSSSAKVESR